MAEIRVTYKRTWQPRQYESEGLELSITETVDVRPVKDVREADAQGKMLASMEALIYRQLAEVGEQAMLARLSEKPTPQPDSSPTRPGHPGSRR